MSAPREPFNMPENTPLAWILRQWDVLLLGCMGLVVLVCGIYLILPQKQFTLSLSPVPAEAFAYTAIGPSAEEGMSLEPAEDAPAPEVKKHRTPRKRAKKKPGKPPVLNLNTATVTQLDLLPGVGPKLAARIVEYRKSHGAFTEVSQIQEVKGIGEKNFAKMQPYLKI